MRRNYLFMFVALALCVCSCNNNKKDKGDEIVIPENPRTDLSMERGHEDTTAVLNLANQFLQSLKDNNVEDALNLLYEVDSVEAKPLSAERRNQLRKTLSAFPVESYVVEELLFYSDSDTEVRYSTEMFKKDAGDDRPNTVKGSLHPYRIDNQWYLTIQPEKVESNYQDD